MSNRMMNEAMLCETQRQADALLAEMVQEIVAEQPELQYAQAEHIARTNVGYFAGHHSHATRDRVERLFKTAHPVFGAIRYNGAPTTEQAMQIGLEFGAATREQWKGRVDAMKKVAEIPRVDSRRVGYFKVTGIRTRALGVDGKYGQFDLSELTCDSLLRFLRSRGGRNDFAEATVLMLLDYEVPENMHAPVRA